MPAGRRGSEKTIVAESSVGQRLAKVQKPETMFIVFQGGRVPIAKRITIGRDPENSISLDDVMVSRKHAVIQKVKDDYFIEDLGSTNGTFLNGQPVPPGKYMRITPQDKVRIGRSELSLQHLTVK
jgi:pSer/pThr/pTyr-binding forkhead associated (FHA) protein